MAVTHRLRRARDLDRDRAAEAVSDMFHLDVSLFPMDRYRASAPRAPFRLDARGLA
ncbi:hypothetical protein ABIA07_005955 [Bradyrhizobium yuanmingense]